MNYLHLTRTKRYIISNHYKTKKHVFILCLLLTIQAYAGSPPIKRKNPISITTSVAIPCCGKHFRLLYSLLQSYCIQTVVPDEVIISLSDVEQLNTGHIDQLEKFKWPFPLKILRKKGKESAGQNRNIAAQHCEKDVILFQDADDIPHPQRIEIVKYIFENYVLDHLLHLYIPPQCHFEYYDPRTINLTHHADLESHVKDTYLTTQNWPCSVHNGNICLTTELAQICPWESVFGYDKDVEYNVDLYHLPIRTAVLAVPLILYRNELSSFAHSP